MIKLNAKQLRVLTKTKEAEKVYSKPLCLVLDNVFDTYNIGSFFRLADALGVNKIYLTGKTVAPPNIKIHRASVGLWRWVPWEQHRSALELIKKLKKEKHQIIAIEQSDQSQSYLKIKPKLPVCLVVGHETKGISASVLKQADVVAEIPLFGVNKSLNVLVAASVVAYQVASFY